MDWNSAMEDNRRMLKRIVALLFALSGLAERLTGLPRPVRAFVLTILRPAESVARDFVVETAQDHGMSASLPEFVDALQTGDDPADAMRFAQSFRVLAVLLGWLAENDYGPGKRFVTPAACNMTTRLLAAMRLEPSQLFPATARLAVERRDSS